LRTLIRVLPLVLTVACQAAAQQAAPSEAIEALRDRFEAEFLAVEDGKDSAALATRQPRSRSASTAAIGTPCAPRRSLVVARYSFSEDGLILPGLADARVYPLQR
jgi:hypothetical protein